MGLSALRFWGMECRAEQLWYGRLEKQKQGKPKKARESRWHHPASQEKSLDQPSAELICGVRWRQNSKAS